jgi:hypothetical protein
VITDPLAPSAGADAAPLPDVPVPRVIFHVNNVAALADDEKATHAMTVDAK